ncbi:MAG: metallophosphoesterase [Lentisphaerae bacterium]|jgi:hypothetical protein|nr:metallophosphoesterase [Lentisphaerota bacterium]
MLTFRIMRIVAALAIATAAFLHAQIDTENADPLRNLFEMARQFEIPVMAQPDWAQRQTPPRFRMAWITDLHITNVTSRTLVTAACHAIRDDIKPNFTIVTGDNAGHFWDLSEAEKKEPVGVRRHRWLKRFLDSELAGPYCIVPGDNWPWDFEKVFGATHYSFDFGGWHFHFTSTDNQASGAEGCVTFSPVSWEWMESDLASAAAKPTLFINHEPLWPPSFLDAMPTMQMISRNPHVLAVLGGHLHLDLEFQRDGWRQFVAPAVGRSHRPGFKVFNFHPDAVIIESYEWQENEQAFLPAAKWQQLPVPEKYREALAGPPITGFNPENRRQMAPRPKNVDKALGERSHELSVNMMTFIMSFGVGKLLGQ